MVTQTGIVKGIKWSASPHIQVGAEYFLHVRNDSGETINVKDVVTATGATGAFINVTKVTSLKDCNSITVIGIAEETIPHGCSGKVSLGPTGAPEIDNALKNMSRWVVDHRFAWLPKTVSSGKRVWFKKYVRRRKEIHGLAGESPVYINETRYLPVEYTAWLLTHQAK